MTFCHKLACLLPPWVLYLAIVASCTLPVASSPTPSSALLSPNVSIITVFEGGTEGCVMYRCSCPPSCLFHASFGAWQD